MKSNDPEKAANWWVANFGFTIADDSTRETGDRFIKLRSANDVPVNISGPLDGQTLVESDSGPNLGLEHFGFDVEDIDAEIKPLRDLRSMMPKGMNMKIEWAHE